MAATKEELEQQLKDMADKAGVTYDPSDLEDVWKRDGDLSVEQKKYDFRADNKPNEGDNNNGNPNPWQGGGGGNQSPASAWNSSGGGGASGMFPDWYQGMMQQQLAAQQAAQADTKAKADALYAQLNAQATQGLAINAQDPIIAGQVDAYRAEQERARRNLISGLAERGGPNANLGLEQRMAAEHAGQATAGFQAELLGRELAARRNEIAQALAAQGGILSQDKQQALQAQLAAMNQAIQEANVGLGVGGLNLQQQGLNQANNQFLQALALQQWQAQDNSDYHWATL